VIFLYMLIFIPISLALEYLVQASPVLVFLTAGLAIIPLAVWIRRGTEQIAFHTGPAVGGLLNVTFGNAAELIIALFVLMAGNSNVVKGQITGSIIGNGLLGLGLAVIFGTWRRGALKFNRDQVGLQSTMLMIVLIGLLLPAIFDFTERNIAKAPNAFTQDENLSLVVSGVLILLYIGNLMYTLFISPSESASVQGEGPEVELEQARWSATRALIILFAATVFTALESELVASALEATASLIGVSVFFLGVVVLAIIGNVSEYFSAIYFARRGRINLVMEICVGATIQVALFVAPLLVLISNLIGRPMDLVFANPLELVAIAAVAITVNAIAKDGEVTWFEGVLLVGTYLLMAVAFFFVTPL
jgi:Ca2+:H+ antiporter